MSIKQRIQALCKSEGITAKSLEEELKLGRGYVSKVDNFAPNLSKIGPIADRFGVSVDYLLKGKESNNLSAKDKKDIGKTLSSVLSDLKDYDNALMLNGVPLDDETRELFIASVSSAVEISKIKAKEKYTPKKHKNDK